jgi:hypothetical protein
MPCCFILWFSDEINKAVDQTNKTLHPAFPYLEINYSMKRIFVTLFSCMAMIVAAQAQNTTGREDSLLRHVVLFKFKDGTSAADVKKVEDAFRALPSKIPEIKTLEWGTNNSPEGLNQGFTHCFFLSFGSEQDRAAYLPHPAHKAFGNVLGPHLDKVLVVDYWTKE